MISARKILTLVGGLGVNALLASSIYAQSTTPTTYSIQLQNIVNQTGPDTTVEGYSPFGYKPWALVGQIDTGGADLSAAPVITASDGETLTFPAAPNWPTYGLTGGGLYYRYQAAVNTNNLSDFSSASGVFTFTLGDANLSGVPVQPTVSLDTTSASASLQPVIPMVTSGGTWSGDALQIDADTGATLTLNSSLFSGYNTGNGGAVSAELFVTATYPTRVAAPEKTINIPALVPVFGSGFGETTPLSTVVIDPGELTAGQTYTLQINFWSIADINDTTYFTGTGITGDPPIGYSYYNTSTFITIDAVPLPACIWLMLSGLVGFGTIVRRRTA